MRHGEDRTRQGVRERVFGLVLVAVNIAVFAYWFTAYDPANAQFIPRVFQTSAARLAGETTYFTFEPGANSWKQIRRQAIGERPGLPEGLEIAHGEEDNALGIDQRAGTVLLFGVFHGLFGWDGMAIGFALLRTVLFDLLLFLGFAVTRNRPAAIAVAMAGTFNPYFLSMTVVEPQTPHLVILLGTFLALSGGSIGRLRWATAGALAGLEAFFIHPAFAVVALVLAMAWAWLFQGKRRVLGGSPAFLVGLIVSLCALWAWSSVSGEVFKGPISRIVDSDPTPPSAGAEGYQGTSLTAVPGYCDGPFCLPDQYQYPLPGGRTLEFYGLLNWPFHDRWVRGVNYPLPFSLVIPSLMLLALGWIAFGLGVLGWVRPPPGMRAHGLFLAAWFVIQLAMLSVFENLDPYKLFFSLRCWPPLLLGMGLALARLTTHDTRWRDMAFVPVALAAAWLLSSTLVRVEVPEDDRWADHMRFKRFPAQWVSNAPGQADAIREVFRGTGPLPGDTSLFFMANSGAGSHIDGRPINDTFMEAAIRSVPEEGRVLLCTHSAVSASAIHGLPDRVGKLPIPSSFMDNAYRGLVDRVGGMLDRGLDVFVIDQLWFSCYPAARRYFQLDPVSSDGWYVVYRIDGIRGSGV